MIYHDTGLRKKALLLSYFTVGYNVLEGIVSIFAGLLAGSIALIGFGLDSFVESLSGSVMIWRLKGDLCMCIFVCCPLNRIRIELLIRIMAG